MVLSNSEVLPGVVMLFPQGREGWPVRVTRERYTLTQDLKSEQVYPWGCPHTCSPCPLNLSAGLSSHTHHGHYQEQVMMVRFMPPWQEVRRFFKARRKRRSLLKRIDSITRCMLIAGIMSFLLLLTVTLSAQNKPASSKNLPADGDYMCKIDKSYKMRPCTIATTCQRCPRAPKPRAT